MYRVKSASKKFTPYDKKCRVCGELFVITKRSMEKRECCNQQCVGISRRVTFVQL